MRLKAILHWLLALVQTRRPRTYPGDLVLGVAAARHAAEPFVVLRKIIRTQHVGILGLSGGGKTYFIEHLIRQDIQNRSGFVVFDVHGDLADNIVAYLAERASVDAEVYERTVILEPFDSERTFGFNPLAQHRGTSPFFQAQQFAAIMRSRWPGDLQSPRTTELLVNSLYGLSVGNHTLAQLPALLTRKPFRAALVRQLPPGPVRDYWMERYEQLSPRMQSVVREPVLTRITAFLSDAVIRDVVAQPKSTFDFRSAMHKGQWVIINLSRGRLGENAKILGSLLFTKLELDIMSRATVPPRKRKLFAVYADELQNLAGENFARLIAEARKYNVSLVAGHQYWKQLEPPLREAMLAAGSHVFFRLHFHDAVELSGELAATERRRYARLLTQLERGHCSHRQPTASAHVRAGTSPAESNQTGERALTAAECGALYRPPVRDSAENRHPPNTLGESAGKSSPHRQ